MFVRRLPCQMILLALALVLLLGLTEDTLWAQDGGRILTLAEYQTLVGQAIDRLEQASAGDQAQRLDEVRSQFSEISAVQLATGEFVEIMPLVDGAVTAEVALVRLRLVHDQLALATSDNTDTRLGYLGQVLERPEFRSESLVDKIRRWVQEVVKGVLPDQASELSVSTFTGPAADLVTWVIAGVGAVILVIILSFWLQGLLGSFVADVELRRRKTTGDMPPLTAVQVQHQAMLFAQAGDYRQAMRQLYLASLLRLEDHGLIRRNRSLTNREVIGQVPETTGLRSHFQPVVDTFDRVWYGMREPDVGAYRGFEQEITSLHQAISETGDHGSAGDGEDWQ